MTLRDKALSPSRVYRNVSAIGSCAPRDVTHRFDAVCIHDLATLEWQPVRLNFFIWIPKRAPSDLLREAWVHLVRIPDFLNLSSNLLATNDRYGMVSVMPWIHVCLERYVSVIIIHWDFSIHVFKQLNILVDESIGFHDLRPQ